MISITQEQITNNWEISNLKTPLVSIQCITYNHENFIAQALEGFLIQKTTFPFEVIVHDDASTDNTANIIREYEQKFPKIIKPIYEKENLYKKRDGSFTKIVNNACTGKYIALCEGDDYWIDENKLQRQIEFLEKNPEYGFCYTKSKVFDQKYGIFLNSMGNGKISFREIYLTYDIPTATIVYRRDLHSKYLEFKEQNGKKWIVGDYPLSLWFALNSKIKYFDLETSVYRVLEKSASHFTTFEEIENFKFNIYENIQLLFLNIYKTDYNELKQQSLNDINLYLCKKAILLGLYTKAKHYSKKIICSDLKSILIKILCHDQITFHLISFFLKKR